MNIVTLTGNVTSIYDNATNIKVTVADNYKDKTTFIPVTFFNENTCNFIRKYVRVGDHIGIENARLGSYKDNQNKECLSVIGATINFEGYRNPNKNSTNVQEENTKENTDNFVDMPNSDSDELPWQV